MNPVLSIALVSPHAWPPFDDLTWRIAAEASALARRGHRVTILAPGRGRELVAESRRLLAAVRDGDAERVLAQPGTVRVVPIGRAVAAGRRRIGGPIDLSAVLQDILSRVPFDVVHVHEPLAPTPALAALRHARGVTAATFHRQEQVAGVAFVRPFLDRAIARLDVVTAASDTVRRAVAEMFDRDAAVIPDAADVTRFAPVDPRADAGLATDLVVIARGTDRLGVRFAMSVVRALPPEFAGHVTVLGSADAHSRTAAAIPNTLRDRVSAVADLGDEVRDGVLRTGAIALVATPEDLAGSVVSEAMARGMVVVAPRCPESTGVIVDDIDGVLLPPFSREEWARALGELAADTTRRERIGAAAARVARERGIDTVAAMLEERYLAALSREAEQPRTPRTAVIADLRVRPGGLLTPRRIVDLCAARGIGAVAVIGDRTIESATEAAQIAAGQLTVVVGQQVHTRDGELVGLFLGSAVPDGLGAAETADRIHAQGGVVMVPHPVWGEPPAADVIAAMRARCDCFEVVVGPASTLRGAVTTENARLMQRHGTRVVAGSGASEPEAIGSSHLLMPPFATAAEFLAALDDAVPVQRRRGLRPRTPRERRRPEGAAT